jgi:hypothetical protein
LKISKTWGSEHSDWLSKASLPHNDIKNLLAKGTFECESELTSCHIFKYQNIPECPPRHSKPIVILDPFHPAVRLLCGLYQSFLDQFNVIFMTSHRTALLLDWDSTLTMSDTLAAIASIADHTQAHGDASPSDWWQVIVDAYIDDFSTHKAEYEPKPEQRTTAQDESAWLASLADVEKRSFERAIATERFGAVIDRKSFEQQVNRLIHSGQIELREGWFELLLQEHVEIGIISVNWSRSFIQECLRQNARAVTAEAKESVTRIVEQMPIAANEVFVDPEVPWPFSIYTSKDKSFHAKSMVAEVLKTNSMVYVGDSITDFDCLVAADIGICIRDLEMSSGQHDLASTLERVGLNVKPLAELIAATIEAHSQSDKQQLWWTGSLAEIAKLVSLLE